MRILITSVATLVCAASFAQGILQDNTPLRQWYINMATGQGYEITPGGNVGIQAGPVTSYSNVTTFSGFVATGGNRADDLHMTQGGLVNGFSFIYSDAAGGPQLVDAPVTFYVGGPGDPVPGAVLQSLLITGLPGDGHWIITVDLAGSGFEFVAPADIWAGLDLSAASRSHARHSLWNPPTIGSSHDVFYRFDGTPGFYWFGGNPVANFGWEIKMVPEPGAIAAIGTGLLGLLALRRRK